MANTVIIVGNVGKDPEIKSYSWGEVATFSIATSEKWKDKNSGDPREKTTWVPIKVTSSGLVGIVSRYIKKGSKLFIRGKFVNEKYQDSHGNDRYWTGVELGFGAELEMLGGKPSQDSGQSSGTAGKWSNEFDENGHYKGGNDDLSDEIPF